MDTIKRIKKKGKKFTPCDENYYSEQLSCILYSGVNYLTIVTMLYMTNEDKVPQLCPILFDPMD